MPDELVAAIGLVWGHLGTYQYEEAYQLAEACLRIWPQEKRLILMRAFAAVELLEPLDDDTLAVLEQAECRDWVALVRRRAEFHGSDEDAPHYMQ